PPPPPPRRSRTPGPPPPPRSLRSDPSFNTQQVGPAPLALARLFCFPFRRSCGRHLPQGRDGFLPLLQVLSSLLHLGPLRVLPSASSAPAAQAAGASPASQVPSE